MQRQVEIDKVLWGIAADEDTGALGILDVTKETRQERNQTQKMIGQLHQVLDQIQQVGWNVPESW